ncbi:MAG TPA: hypothetical protein VMV69_02545 [Pirellulales bacterium]|nr:hypothetical protein [Pirellulales bacterium]
MASIFRQRVTRYRLPDGTVVKKATAGALKSPQEQSDKWYGEYRDALSNRPPRAVVASQT